jgi:hypothetical protein
MATIRKRGTATTYRSDGVDNRLQEPWTGWRLPSPGYPRLKEISRDIFNVESSRLEKTTLLELLERYERQILPTHKGQQVKAYRLETLHYNCKPFYLVNNTWRQ